MNPQLDEQSSQCPEPTDRPDLWPWSAHRKDDGELMLGGIGVSDIAKQYGTPIYLMDMDDLEGRATVWASAMAEDFWPGYGLSGGSAYYAAKAMMSVKIAQTVTSCGMGIDTASLGELRCALAAGVDPNLIGLHGNNKPESAIVEAIQAGESGIGRIVVDSFGEIDLIDKIANKLGRSAKVMVRVTTGVHAGGHEFIATAHEDQKFGLSLHTGAAKAAVTEISQRSHLKFIGLHAHIGSQIYDLEAFARSAEKLLGLVADLAESGIETEEVDLGGGYAIAYTGDDKLAPSQQEVTTKLAEAVRTTCENLDIPVPRVSIEPGRSVVGPTTITLYEVGTVKDVPIGEGRNRLYVSVNGGMSDNIRPALYQANYTATLANRTSSTPLVPARVVGGHCESGDIIVRNVLLPADVKAGDLLAVPCTGAYGHSMASNYNMFPRPGTLGIKANEAHWLVRPETCADIFSRDPYYRSEEAEAKES
ncbi:MAG: diaminopimelate decarboxylase [Actinomycetaceae bacterium]|nr:diaminopimelate decarboxylase [Actinomycetaceae bacterium]